MKQTILALTTCFLFVCNAANSQTRVPELNPEPAGSGRYYYSNLGQIADDTGGLHPEVLYYTEQGAPSLYLTNKGAHFVARRNGVDSGAADTLYRVAMEFKCSTYSETPCGSIATYEPGIDTLNYYLPHCSSGITGVTGNAGIVYQDVFTNTDFHFYSNAFGMKGFIKFKPGSNPADFVLKFSGQDSIAVIDSILNVFVSGQNFTLPIIDAYEVDSRNIIYPLSWTPDWVSLGNGEVGISTSSYNPSRNLIIRIGTVKLLSTTAIGNLYWATYYGTGSHAPAGAASGASVEEVPLICANTNDDVFHAMSINAGVFPRQNYSVTLLPYTNKGYDCYISKFEKNLQSWVATIGAPVRKWATYFGGSGDDKPRAIVEQDRSSSTGELYVAGISTSSSLPARSISSPAFHQTSMNGNGDGFIASFNKTSGSLQYDTYFGGSAQDEILCLASDPANNMLYFGGSTSSTTTSTSCSTPTSTNFSLCAGSGTRYYQTTPGIAFLASMNTTTKELKWSTYFEAEVRSIAVSGTGSSHSVYIGGYVGGNAGSPNSSDWTGPKTSPPVVPGYSSVYFPLCNPGGGAYFQSVTGFSKYGNIAEGYIARFDNNFQLAWNTFFGGSGEDFVWKLGTTSSGELYVTGATSTDDENPNPTTVNSANNAGYFPTYYTTGAYHQPFAGVSAGFTNPPFWNAFIARFNTSQNLSWCSYFGGSGGAFQWWPPSGNPYGITCDLAIDPAGGAYMSGFSRLDNTKSSGSNIPICSTCMPFGQYNQSQNASTGISSDQDTYDGWLVQFNSSNYPTWVTNFGGFVINQGGFNAGPPADPSADERINAIAVGGAGSNTTLYMTGTTHCDNTPNVDFDPISSNDYYQGSYSGDGDVFIGRFFAASTPETTGIYAAGSAGSANLQVSPNPSSGVFDVTYHSTANDADASVKVVNGIGQLVDVMTRPIHNRQAKFTLDLGNLPPGLYILNVNGECTTLIRK